MSTKRCACVMRCDHTSAPKYLSGAGLPILLSAKSNLLTKRIDRLKYSAVLAYVGEGSKEAFGIGG